MKKIIAEFKQKLQNGGVMGIFSKTCDPAFIEVMGHAGADYVIIDLEHGPNSVETAQNLIRSAQVAGLMPIVRVKEDCPWIIGEVLDIGAGGIQVPQVTCRQEAENVIQRAKFAPMGQRGVCRFVRAADYSAKDRFEYFQDANDAVIVLQIEGQDGIDNLADIIQVNGIDVIFIGPYDLSQALGIPGQIDHPLVVEKTLQIVDICRAKGIAVGTFADTVENAKKWRSLGIQYLSYSVDVGIFHEAVANLVNHIK